jgi:3-oxoacyl-(acyl-carrier-protein) synthase
MEHMANDSLVVTGVGAVGAFGDTPNDFWDALTAGQPTFRRSQSLPGNPLVGEIVDFDLERCGCRVNRTRAPVVSQYALAAASQAIGQARLDPKVVDYNEVATVYGTAHGSAYTDVNAANNATPGQVKTLPYLENAIHSPASEVSIAYGFRGPFMAVPMGWASSGYAIAVAADLVTFGHAPYAVVIVSDALGTASIYSAYQSYKALGLLSPNDGRLEAMRPFDARHNGAILGEGAAAIIIETADTALRRGATPLLRLAGWGVASDSFGGGPKGRGPNSIRGAMATALTMAARSNVDLAYAGSYCTADADRAEATALAEHFGLGRVPPVTNIRGTVGEIGGVTGMLNLIAAVRSLHTGIIPATVGCEVIDPSCALDVVTAPRQLAHIDSVLCNSFWVNGINTALVLQKYS